MNEDIQVCQPFFVNTLNVNKGRVYYYFSQNKNKPTITPAASRHGKHAKKVIPESKKQEIRDHIKRFPVVVALLPPKFQEEVSVSRFKFGYYVPLVCGRIC